MNISFSNARLEFCDFLKVQPFFVVFIHFHYLWFQPKYI
jgi:hypothetical protein